jgi:anti-sigma regulatory factor (Ser/Thr protein kinase)
MRTLDITRDDRAPVVARRALEDFAADLDRQRFDDLRLLVTELVSNSVRHGDGETVRIILDRPEPDTVRCEVIDDGHGFLPVARHPDREPSGGGWGLHLVEQLSDTWGVREGSTHVWFELGL